MENNKMMTGMERILKKAIEIDKPIKVFWPQYGKEEIFNPERYCKNQGLQHSYSTNNGTIAYIENERVFVLPYTRKAMKELKELSFAPKGFYVPFSNWDYPVKEKRQWDELLELSKEIRRLEFINDCQEIAESKGVKEISEKDFYKCFKLPYSGIEVSHPMRGKNYTYPAIQGYFLDSYDAKKIGTYCINNGVCVFINTTGDTFVTKSKEVLSHLIECGYESGELYVPLSNGEAIVNRHFAEKWRRISA